MALSLALTSLMFYHLKSITSHFLNLLKNFNAALIFMNFNVSHDYKTLKNLDDKNEGQTKQMIYTNEVEK